MLAGILAMMVAAQTHPVAMGWEFDTPAAAKAWAPNSHIADLRVQDGALSGRVVQPDPYFICSGFEFEATPWQYVVIRARVTRTGRAQLFWTGTTEGPHGGFSEERSLYFTLRAGDAWQDAVLFPFWHPEGAIRKLRLDLYEDTAFELDAIRVHAWGAPGDARDDAYAWDLAGEGDGAWRIHPATADRFAGPLRLPVEGRPWVSIRMSADRDGAGEVLWARPDATGVITEPFHFKAGASRVYNIEMEDRRRWGDIVVALGVRVPPESGARLESVAVTDGPAGPAALDVAYFGFDAALNRAGRPAAVGATVVNRGGEPSTETRARIDLPRGLAPAPGADLEVAIPPLASGERRTAAWSVVAEEPGAYAVTASFAGEGAPDPCAADLLFAPHLDVEPADYVPEPRPVATEVDIMGYYYPGWDSDRTWDPIRQVAPIRKPLLGYYDEGRPEVVDWQIKWAVENGITGLLVDWYWAQGQQRHFHWFDAFRKARYRGHLKVAIMWANHNAPNTHTVDDWRAVTREWIDRYFDMPEYYRIEGKPAVFIWSPSNIRSDLGGSAAVRAMLDESQAAARAAGYDGIYYVAMGTDRGPDHTRTLDAEGYAAITQYHEWGTAFATSSDPGRAHYRDVVASSPATWERRHISAGKLGYFPVVDTGWDSRPWHGARARVIEGRTADLFEQLLREARRFAAERDKPLVILGPVNEWGEGSYIEPCVEFGFDMYERVRAVFGKGEPASWPVNLAPGDVGLGPYEFAEGQTRSWWDFSSTLGGWRAMMGVADFQFVDDGLRFRTLTADPALLLRPAELDASRWKALRVRMRIDGALPHGSEGQVYWAGSDGRMSEAASERFPLKPGGGMQEYRIALGRNPHWRGAIGEIRFDPCDIEEVEVVLGEFRFLD